MTGMIGRKAPEFSRTADDGSEIRLSDLLQENVVVLFFYPRDNTPVCTTEACEFRDTHSDFLDAGAVVIGISGDSDSSHQNFARTHNLPYRLISDSDGSLRKSFRVPRTLGLLPGRVTYVIDREGTICHVFSSAFNGARHVEEALQTVRRLQASG